MNNVDWRSARAESFIAWKAVNTIARGLGAVAYTELYYSGLILGSEFVTYDVNKLYFCLSIQLGGSTGTSTNSPSLVAYDEANNAHQIYRFGNMAWDVTGAQMIYNMNSAPRIQDIWFSCLSQNTLLTYMDFRGYRLDITP